VGGSGELMKGRQEGIADVSVLTDLLTDWELLGIEATRVIV
jgi:hypothetical protein